MANAANSVRTLARRDMPTTEEGTATNGANVGRGNKPSQARVGGGQLSRGRRRSRFEPCEAARVGDRDISHRRSLPSRSQTTKKAPLGAFHSTRFQRASGRD